MTDSQKKLLDTLLRTPTQTFKEGAMATLLADHALKRGCGVWRDEHNNVIITKGSAGSFPMVAAHIDTVQPVTRAIIPRWDGGIVYGTDAEGKRIGCGADCKTGVYVCLQLLDIFENIKVGFFAAEECGCVGASKLDPAQMKDVGYVLEFDCPSRRILSYTSSGIRLFDNEGEFIRAIIEPLKELEVRWQRHPYTDVHRLAPDHGISCLNLASGYHNWHASDEYLVLAEVEDAVFVGRTLIERLGCNAYPFVCNAQIVGQVPLCEVTGLRLP